MPSRLDPARREAGTEWVGGSKRGRKEDQDRKAKRVWAKERVHSKIEEL